MNKYVSSVFWRIVLTKLGTLICIILWGVILWFELPEQLSYISILYGMAVQFWISCVIGVIVGYSHHNYYLCKQTKCEHHQQQNKNNELQK